MRKVTYLKSAYRTLEKYDKDVQSRIIKAIDGIPRGDIKRLKGHCYPDLFRLRVGKYRIIYSLSNDDELIIAKIDTRGDVYK